MKRELPVDLVEYDIARIESRRQRLYDSGFAPSCRHVLIGDAFTQLVTRVTDLVPRSASAVVFDALRALAGRELVESEAMLLAWRLAGNWDRLKQGQPLLTWTGQLADEWAPIEILRTELTRNYRKELVHEFHLCVLAGTACTLRPRVAWSRNACFMVARRLGFSRRHYVYQQPPDLVGLRCYGRISAERSRGAPAIREIECPPRLVLWNRKNVLMLRCRQGRKCPQGWTHHCHHCAVGYDTCPAGTHYMTYVTQPCPGCQKLAITDPEDPTGVCLECSRRLLLKS